MSRTESVQGLRARLVNRYHVRRAYRESTAPSFAFLPEPRMIGRLARGRQLCAGKFLFAGDVVEAPDRIIWDIETPSAAFERELHGFAWLDDLAAVGEGAAGERARTWTREWIRRFGRGAGRGWSPERTGQRLIRWINHSACLLDGDDGRSSEAFRRSLGHQIEFVSRRWREIPRGTSRFETLAALVHASLVLAGKGIDPRAAVTALARECDREIDSGGSVPNRNPEELLDVLSLLVWTVSMLADAGEMPPGPILGAIGRIAPTLRTLRHSDGGLARFHGGGRGIEGRLDRALANSAARGRGQSGQAMGFARLSAGRTSVIVDVAPPPTGNLATGHASTLAFEMTSGRRPLVVSCGSGVSFGAGWAKAGRTTASHSVLEVDGNPSSGFDPGRRKEAADMLVDTPRNVRVRRFSDLDGKSVHASHDGYAPTYGLVHIRALELSPDGGRLGGDDTLTATSEDEIRRFERMRDRTGRPGTPFSIRFHLHPEVTARADPGGMAVSLSPGNGETWIFRHDGSASMSLQPGAYLEKGRLAPRETDQIVLSALATAHVTHVHWTLERAEGSRVHIRDLTREENEIAG